MSEFKAPRLLSAAAAEFSPGQTAHPSPAASERSSSSSSSSPSSARLSALYLEPHVQLQQPYYKYPPFPLFNGYTQAYEFHATPPPYYFAPPQGIPWYPEQNLFGHGVNTQDAFDNQFEELQCVRNGNIPNQINHFGTRNKNLKSGNNAHKKKNEKQKEKVRQRKNEYKKLKRANKKQQLLEQQKAEHPTDAELDTGCVLVLEGSGV